MTTSALFKRALRWLGCRLDIHEIPFVYVSKYGCEWTCPRCGAQSAALRKAIMAGEKR